MCVTSALCSTCWAHAPLLCCVSDCRVHSHAPKFSNVHAEFMAAGACGNFVHTLLLQGVTKILSTNSLPARHEIILAKISLEQLQQALGHRNLSTDLVSYLLVFIFRPFTSHLINQPTAITAPLALAVLSLTHHVLHHLDCSSEDRKQQHQQDVLGAKILADIATCSVYPWDSSATGWLHSLHPSQHGLCTYLASPNCPKTPLSQADAAPIDSACQGTDHTHRSTSSDSLDERSSVRPNAPGLQLLLQLLPSEVGGSQNHLTAVCNLLLQLVTSSSPQLSPMVTAACAELRLEPLWQLWLNIESPDGVHAGPLSCSAPYQLEGPGQLVIALLTRSDEIVLGRHMQSLAAVLQQLSNHGELKPGQQQHIVDCTMHLVRHAVGRSKNMKPAAAATPQHPLQNPLLDALLCFIVSGLQSGSLHTLQQRLVFHLASMLLHEPTDSSTAAQLGDAVFKHWPLRDPFFRQQWLGLASAAGSRNTGSTPPEHKNQYADALAILPPPQQCIVLQLLTCHLQAYPADALGMPVQQLVSQIIALSTQHDQLIPVDSSNNVTMVSPLCGASLAGAASADGTAFSTQLLRLLDAETGAVYCHLILLLDSEHITAENAGADATDAGYHQQRLVVLDMLQQAMALPHGAASLRAAMHRLQQQPATQKAVVAAAAAMLWWHFDMQLPLLATLQLLVELTGPSVALSVLKGIANYNRCSIVQLLIQLADGAGATAGAAPAMPNHAPLALLMLVRLLPHVGDSSLAVVAVHRCLGAATAGREESMTVGCKQQPALPPIITAACESSNIFSCQLQIEQFKAFLQLLCRLDAQARQNDSIADGSGLLNTYLAGLLMSLSLRSAESSSSFQQEAGALEQLLQVSEVLSSAAAAMPVPSGSTMQSGGPHMAAEEGTAALLRTELVRAHLPSLALLLACKPDTAAAAASCLMRILPGFSDDEVRQVVMQARLSTTAANPTEVAAGEPAGQVAFFSSEQQKVQRSRQPTTSEHFAQLSAVLRAHVEMAKAKMSVDSSGGQLHLPSLSAPANTAEPAVNPSGSGSHTSDSTCSSYPGSSSVSQQLGMVITPTTLDNINRVLDVVENPTPLLLEGPTGVGKSATVAEAAERLGKHLIRFNMSSRITPDDLLARTVMKARPDGTIAFELLQQPFIEAFANGHWLLLDELNLAPDDVLQCIEQALDKGVSHRPSDLCFISGRD